MFINKNLIHNKNERGEEMNYRTIDMGSYQLHFIQTDRFKTITVRVCLRDNIVKEEITLRNFLTTFLTYSTDTYRTKRELVLKAQDLYAVNAYTKSYRAGRFNMISFYLSMLNEKYTEKGMLSKSLDFLADIIFHPNFYDEEKFQEAFQFLYQSMETSILGLKENPTLYSAVRMLEEMDPDMPYAYHEHGYLEDLEKIDKKSLEEYYHKIISSSLVDIYVIGSFDEEEMLNLLKEKMAFETFKRPKVSQLILQEKLPRRSKVRKEEIDGNQSKLSIGCKIGELTEFERNYVLSIYNMILGSGSESKFFRIIREKHSMAYYVYSSLNLTLAYDGEFGFTATLTVNMESKNAGLYANLFYYNEQTEELEFISAGQIDPDGNVELVFTHASDYTIVVDAKIMSDNGQADNKSDETIPAPKTDDSTSKYAWNNTIIIIIGICIILIVFGAVFYVRKKSGSEEE